MNQHCGLFVTIEGGEGSGKSSLMTSLSSQLKQLGYDVVTTREPGGTPMGEKIRDWVLTRDSTFSLCSKAELLLFLAARAQHIEEVIYPALKAGKIVLCDRFNDSTIVYQGFARGLGMDYVKGLCDYVCGDVVPEMTLLLDLDPREGLLRSKRLEKAHAARGELDRIESEHLSFHQKIREGFLQLAKDQAERIYVIDANMPQLAVLQLAKAKIEQFKTLQLGH